MRLERNNVQLFNIIFSNLATTCTKYFFFKTFLISTATCRNFLSSFSNRDFCHKGLILDQLDSDLIVIMVPPDKSDTIVHSKPETRTVSALLNYLAEIAVSLFYLKPSGE